jgi:hypothetical protein
MTPTDSTAATSLDPGLLELQQEIKTYRRALPQLLADGHEGKFVLIKGDEVLSIWDSFDDVCQAARSRFDFGEVFLTQPIDRRFLSVPFPKELNPDPDVSHASDLAGRN